MAYHIATEEQLMAMSDPEFSRQYSQLGEWLRKNKGHKDFTLDPQLPRDRSVRAVIGIQDLYHEDFMGEETLRGLAHWAKRHGEDEVIFSTGGSSSVTATA